MAAPDRPRDILDLMLLAPAGAATEEERAQARKAALAIAQHLRYVTPEQRRAWDEACRDDLMRAMLGGGRGPGDPGGGR